VIALNSDKIIWKCGKCRKELVLKKIIFSYQGHTFSHEVYACSECGKVLIPKELAEGRIARVEEQLEDK
jgi:DNA-directed RNA polymerase subunit RPC12/RpoP